jgi:acyl-CoA thioester hydrolase
MVNAMPLTYQRTFNVRSYECDANGHVNQTQYLRYMQESAVEASASVGYDDPAYARLGTVWLIRETEVEYLNALKYGDSVTVTTWVGDFRRVRSRRFYELKHTVTGDLYARGNSDWVYLERDTMRPQPSPMRWLPRSHPILPIRCIRPIAVRNFLRRRQPLRARTPCRARWNGAISTAPGM